MRAVYALAVGQRTLVLMRHGSAESDGVGGDFARDLTLEGRAQAVATARALHACGCVPDQVLCSSARRAEATWQAAAAAVVELAAARVCFIERLYLASADALADAIAEVDEAVECLVVVAHNPGLQELSLRLSRNGAADARAALARGFSPATAVVLRADALWSRLAVHGAGLAHVLRPG